MRTSNGVVAGLVDRSGRAASRLLARPCARRRANLRPSPVIGPDCAGCLSASHQARCQQAGRLSASRRGLTGRSAVRGVLVPGPPDGVPHVGCVLRTPGAEHLANRTSRVCGIHVVGDQAGMAITAIQCTVQATSNSGIGSIRTRCLSPRNARSDMAVSRQVPTPSITGGMRRPG